MSTQHTEVRMQVTLKDVPVLDADLIDALTRGEFAIPVDADQTCPICLEEFSASRHPVTKLPCWCGIAYHTECIIEWIKQAPRCTVCCSPVGQIRGTVAVEKARLILENCMPRTGQHFEIFSETEMLSSIASLKWISSTH